MNVLIIDQCSGSKKCPEWFDPLAATDIDAHTLDNLLGREQTPNYPARELYTGRQQQYIDRAVDRLRDAGDTVDRLYISAGFGLVGEATELPPYEVTFRDYDTAGIRERAMELEIESDLREWFDQNPAYDVVFFPLGRDYYASVDIARLLDTIDASTIVVLFNNKAVADDKSNVISIPARIDQAEEQGTTNIALKGHYLKQFADHRANGAVIQTPEDIQGYCMASPTQQSGLEDYE